MSEHGYLVLFTGNGVPVPSLVHLHLYGHVNNLDITFPLSVD